MATTPAPATPAPGASLGARSTAADAARLRRVLIALFAIGWTGNHYVGAIPALKAGHAHAPLLLDSAFAVYAVGLLPGLLGGGRLSDRIGRRPLTVTGAVVAAGGNALIAVWPVESGLLLGRLVVGVGLGLVVGAGSAWAADLGGVRGATLAGAMLTSGFAIGPLVSGVLAQLVPAAAAVSVPFATAAGLGAAAAATGARVPSTGGGAESSPAEAGGSTRRLARGAFVAALPMAVWVFSSATVAFMVLANRVDHGEGGAWVPGLIAVIALGTGVVTQFAVRRFAPRRRTASAGLATAAAGLLLASSTGAAPGLGPVIACAVLLGIAYGLCLRAALRDIETLAPPAYRGVVVGGFYAVAYLAGFGLPVLVGLAELRFGLGPVLLALAALAAITAVTLAAPPLRGAVPRRRHETGTTGHPI